MNGTISNSEYEKYLVYPNETIDKLTVNRTFDRLFDAIDETTSTSELILSGATDVSYGTAKFSPSAEYAFEKPSGSDTDYKNSMLNIGQLYDMSKKLTDHSTDSFLVSPASAVDDGRNIGDIRYWVRSPYADSRFTFMPNGVNMYTCCFDIGFDGISNVLGEESSKKDVTVPVAVSSYDNTIDIDRDSHLNISDYINELHTNASESETIDDDAIWCLENIDGESMNVPFIVPMNVTLRHNLCNYTKYSAYKQSYVEITMSSSLSVKSLFESKYDRTTYQFKDDVETTDAESVRKRLFTQKPMVMAQICFYNEDSNPLVLFGYDSGPSQSVHESSFSSHNRLSQKPLYQIDENGVGISPVNGSVMVRKIENKFDSKGNIIDNLIYFDVILKFMAGSASDPEMDFAMRLMNSRSRVQFAMIGV